MKWAPMELCFAHPAVKGIMMWGFWEGRHWRPEAALWRKDWTIKPNRRAYVNLMDEWKTRGHEKIVDGALKFRGFFGEYLIHAGENTWSASLTSTGATAAKSVGNTPR